jgi:N-acetylneuraminic acid mutarotase
MTFFTKIALVGLGLKTCALAGPSAAESCSSSGRWKTLAPVPNTRQEHGVAAIGDTTIAAVGGVVADGFNLSSTDLVQLYDITSNTWKTVAPVPIKVNHPNVASVGSKLYVLGGLIEGPRSGAGLSINWVASGDSFAYDTNIGTWSQLPTMPPGTEKGSAVTVAHGSVIYLAGGMTTLTPGAQDAVNSVITFDTSSNTWQRLPAGAAELPESRQHSAGGVLGTTLVVAAGRRYSQTMTRNTIFQLDLTNTTAGWKTSKTRLPTARGGISGGAVGSRMYVFGGEGNPATDSGVFNQTESFDVPTQRATSLAVMAFPRHGTQAAVANGKIYIPGGGLQQDGKPVFTNGTATFFRQTNHFDVYTPC